MRAIWPSDEVIRGFRPFGKIAAVDSHGEGNINDTFLVRVDEGKQQQYIVLQRINKTVFPDPIATVRNSALVATHIENKTLSGSRLVPILINTRNGEHGLVDDAGQVWRAWSLLDGVPLLPVISMSQAFSMGNTLAKFQNALLDFDPSFLSNTLPNFHDFRPKILAFERALRTSALTRIRHAGYAIEETREYIQSMKPIWAEIENQASLHPRVIHGDAKVENMLYEQTSKTCFLVDLDTVMIGSILIDFGDLARSGAATVSEDQVAPPGEGIDLSNLFAICDGYLEIAKDFILPAEVEILPVAGAAMALILAVRFMTDWLAGDKYFKITYPTHNLARARGQLSIVRAILEKRDSLYGHVNDTL